MSESELLEFLIGEVRELRAQVTDIHTRLTVLENIRALAWKWGAGAAGAVAFIVSVGHTIWSMF